MTLSDVITVEHIDPRTHHLICGLENEFNEIMADHSYNSRKTNRFVPYRVCEHNAPVTFGDYAEFLIEDEWVVCEFGGAVWWAESNRIGNSCTVGGRLGAAGVRALTPEQRSEKARKANAAQTPEQRRERQLKAAASQTPEQRSENARKANAAQTPEQRSRRSRDAAASRTPEQRSESARKATASLTPEQRSDRVRKGHAKKTPEQRSEVVRKMNASLTPDQRSQRAAKGWETRRANAEKKSKEETDG